MPDLNEIHPGNPLLGEWDRECIKLVAECLEHLRHNKGGRVTIDVICDLLSASETPLTYAVADTAEKVYLPDIGIFVEDFDEDLLDEWILVGEDWIAGWGEDDAELLQFYADFPEHYLKMGMLYVFDGSQPGPVKNAIDYWKAKIKVATQ